MISTGYECLAVTDSESDNPDQCNGLKDTVSKKAKVFMKKRKAIEQRL